jgi:heptosyltransferase-2
VLTTPVGHAILQGQKNIDEIIVYDKKGKHRGIRQFFNFVSTLKCLAIDLAIVPHRSLRSALMVYLSNIPNRFGFDTSQGKFFFNKLIKYHKEKHDLERNLFFLEDFVADVESLDKKIDFSFNNKTEIKVFNILLEKDFFGQKIVGIHTGSKWQTKKWPVLKFIDLIEKLDIAGDKIIVFGDKEDTEIDNYLKFKNKSANILNLVGQTNVDELISMLRYLSVYVSNDSGPMHISAGLGIPVIAIFGPTTKDLGFYPYNDKSKVIEVKLSCRPCGMHGGNSCPKKHFKCMNDISSDTVFEEIENLINNK